MLISGVVNTYNEEKNIDNCLKSIRGIVEEIVIVDMYSTDKTVEIAKKYGAKIFFHEYKRYVEPARNFALSKASGKWILLMDADEELPKTLAKTVKDVALEDKADYLEIPRKNIIFNKWISHSRWWPDYLVRFFKSGGVKYSDKIHSPPVVNGRGLKLPAKEKNAIIHHDIQTVSQFIEKICRYSDIQSAEEEKSGHKFLWCDLVSKPSDEFNSRFFSGEGYKDGLHGLSLSLLQSFSAFLVYLKLWEKGGFKDQNITGERNAVFEKVIHDCLYWESQLNQNILEKIRLKVKMKI